jgi:hypothetical protein
MSRRNTRAGKARRRAERQQRARGRRAGRGAGCGFHGRRGRLVLRGARPARSRAIPGAGGAAVPVLVPRGRRERRHLAGRVGLRDDPAGIEDSNEDLQQLVADVVDDARRRAGRDSLAIEWELSGDAPPGKTVQGMTAEADVTLPAALTPA